MGCCASETNELQDARLEDIGKKEDNDAGEMGAPKNDPTKGRKKKYEKRPAITLGYWKQRGLVQPIRFLLEYTEHPYVEKLYEQGDAPGYSMEEWASVKEHIGLDFPSVPYIVDDEAKITDPWAIAQYLAQAYAPELIPEDPAERAEMDMLYAHLRECKQQLTGPCYQGMDQQKLTALAKAKMAPLVAFLGERKYFMGENLSLLDFFFLELCEYVNWLTAVSFYSENKNISGKYIKRMKGLR